MSYGLQTFDSSGNVILDGLDRIGRIVSIYTGTVPAGSSPFWGYVNIVVPGYTADNTIVSNLSNQYLYVWDYTTTDTIVIANPLSVATDFILYIVQV
jgi:hypothetical protein